MVEKVCDMNLNFYIVVVPLSQHSSQATIISSVLRAIKLSYNNI